MRLWKKILIGFLVTLVVLVGLFVLLVGPWPTYKDAKFEQAAYYAKALADIDAAAALANITNTPGPLQAGWAKRSITPPIGTTLAGYGARKGKPSTGVHDELFTKAVVMSDGKDIVAISGADMLIIPPNVAKLCRDQVASETPILPSNILFTASHTHCGPGGWGPGLAGKMSGQNFDPTIPVFLAKAFADAIVEAYKNMKPAQLAYGKADASQYIKNRAREAAVDPELNFMVVSQDEQHKCYVVRFSAHPTIYSDDMMEFSAEYPGALQRNIEKATGAFAMYTGGSLGSSGNRAPEAPTRDERVEAMGQALAKLVLDNAQNLKFESNIDVAAIGIPVGMPSFQLRLGGKNWRLSPFMIKVLGAEPEGWIEGIRLGKLFMVGVPFDFSGETSLDWKQWVRRREYDLWPTGFSSAYCGYLSPDKYYDDASSYETGMMNWFGPNTEAYFTALFHHLTQALAPPENKAAFAQ
jgi:neutral ceramidase